MRVRRTLGSPALFAVVYSFVAASVYFSLGTVAGRALGLTPFVFLAASFFFVLCAMTYVEGASLHQERAGSTVFARYAFNELWSFIAGWALLLDYVILIALTAFTATNYVDALWGEPGSGWVAFLVSATIIASVAFFSIRGVSAARLTRVAVFALLDLAVQALVIVLGIVLVFDADLIVDSIEFGSRPEWSEALFAVTIAAASFIGLESASGLAGEVAVGRRGLKRLVGSATSVVLLIYIGIATVALCALPVVNGRTALAEEHERTPLLGVVGTYYDPGSFQADLLRYGVAGVGAVVLIAAANSGMLGLSRLSFSLARNRQIPSLIGRLHPQRATPYVSIGIAAVLATALVAPLDLDFLIGIWAFGAMLSFTIAHAAVCVSRYREPERDRPYKMPFSVKFRGGELPLPAALGALLAGAGWLSVVLLHEGARYFGGGWLLFGLALYVIYRRTEGKPLLKRVTVPEQALRAEKRRERREEGEYASILVPLLGTPLDDDIVQTAGRLAAGDRDDLEEGRTGAVIEALWIIEVPMSLPMDAALPEARLKEARAALSRAKAVGEEYQGVEVATATVRARRAGQAVVEEARRRGVEAIVLAAEEPSRIRGGALLGGIGGPLDFVGEATRYVVSKAPCRVILTAPPAEPDEAGRKPQKPADGTSWSGSRVVAEADDDDADAAEILGRKTGAKPPTPER